LRQLPQDVERVVPAAIVDEQDLIVEDVERLVQSAAERLERRLVVVDNCSTEKRVATVAAPVIA
jgi:hypothetical protein